MSGEQKGAKEIVDGLIELQRSYSKTYRAIVTEERYNNLAGAGLLKDFDYNSKEIREPLIEHVGNLPIVAAYLYEYIENKNKIDLGHVLAILAVHDIGETEVGDMFSFAKTEAHAKSEIEVAKRLLPAEQFEYFMEYEKGETIDSKYAKAVDKIAPLIHELNLPKVTLERFKIFDYNTDKIVEKRTACFTWDKVLLAVFEDIAGRFREIESLGY